MAQARPRGSIRFQRLPYEPRPLEVYRAVTHHWQAIALFGKRAVSAPARPDALELFAAPALVWVNLAR